MEIISKSYLFLYIIYKDFARNKKTGDFKISDEPRKRATQNDILEFMKEIDNYIAKKYPNLANRIVNANCMDIEKTLLTSQGASSYLLMPRSVIYVTMVMEHNGDVTQLYDSFGGFGIFDDNFSTPDKWFDRIDRLYEDTRRKNEGIYAEGGIHECIIDSNLTGLMAHEAIGHTTEGDTVLKGSVARENVGNMVASELVTLRDYANNINGEICQVPIFIDDEGVTCKDANIIENGVLKEFMHNRETAQELGFENTGNARAWQYMDEPEVRMRNTVIMPGESKLEDMISSIEDGYYFGRCSNGQADSTSEFMFGAVLGYEIKNGKFGRALKDSTISGVAFEVLKTVSMVSDSFEWVPGATCWKKQMNIVGMGGPAIKCKVTVGGK